MKNKDIIFEFIFKLCVLSFVAVLFFMAQKYTKDSRMLPQIVASTIAVLVLLSFAVDIFAKDASKNEKRGGEEKKSEPLRPRISERRRLYLTAAVVLISLVSVCIGGIIFAAPAAFIAFALILEKKKDLIPAVLYSFILTALVYVTLKYFLHVPLMRGLLNELGLI